METKHYQSLDDFLSDIQSDNADIRYAAWSVAGQMNADAVPKLAELMASESRGIVQAASEAITNLAHSSAERGHEEKRLAVMSELLELIKDSHPANVCTLAFRLLARIGDEKAVPSLAFWLYSPHVREEAVYALENILIQSAAEALIGALKNCAEEFKPRIIAALGHRRDEKAMGILCEYLQSANPHLSLAAMKAIARIGKTRDGGILWPDYAELSSRNQNVYLNCLIEYADNLLKNEQKAEAARCYLRVLDKTDDEHFYCAAVLGLSKIDNPIAADAIQSARNHHSYKVKKVVEEVMVGDKP